MSHLGRWIWLVKLVNLSLISSLKEYLHVFAGDAYVSAEVWHISIIQMCDGIEQCASGIDEWGLDCSQFTINHALRCGFSKRLVDWYVFSLPT